jgi:hypothetical protein
MHQNLYDMFGISSLWQTYVMRKTIAVVSAGLFAFGAAGCADDGDPGNPGIENTLPGDGFEDNTTDGDTTQ